ncbi:MAG TPA: hypothetical protein VNY31_08655 [Solirubrobacteraceae bacterium]|jgi:hypothetical protein|nr:hypothetical protein [Solirubrobacteraceae bacterium]
MLLSEFRAGTPSGPRVGLRILVGPVGEITLRVRTDDETEDTEPDQPHSVASLEAHAAATLKAPLCAGMTTVTCPACGSAQEAFEDVAGFRCSSCHQDAWKIRCRRSFSLLRSDYESPAFEPGELARAETAPDREDLLPVEPHGLSALVPGAKSRYRRELQAGEQTYAAMELVGRPAPATSRAV